MKKNILLFCFLLILSIHFITSEHIVNFSSGNISQLAKEDTSSFYNITIKNTDTEEGSEIKQVNITIPDAIIIDMDTLNSDVKEKFSTEGNTITWKNENEYIIGSGEEKHFWFNATSYVAGKYNLSVITFSSSRTSEFNLTIEIQCVVNWLCDEWNECIEDIQTRNCTDINACNSILGKPVETRACGCVPDWRCIPENWSACVDGEQTRNCVNFNACGTDEGKPLEFQNCGCVPDWDCTNLVPKKCPESGAQVRNCTDINACNSILGKPAEILTCTYKKDFGDFVTPVIIIILVLIAVAIIILIELWKKFYLKS